MWYYSDYINVKTDLVDVYSEETDRESPQRWKAFIPHDSFRELFTHLISALERGSPSAIKSLWLYGSYGTGKTFASFTIKHLLEDDLESVRSYLEGHHKVRDLTKRFLALREKGKWIVAYKSSSSHVKSPGILLAEIQDGVGKALEKYGLQRGYNFKDEVISYIKDHSGIWKEVFKKHRLRNFPQFQAPEEVLEVLESNGSEAIRLLDKIVRLLEEDHILLLNTPDKVKNWLKEEIDKNFLQGILFIWDEFTDYFQINTALSGLQELAHLTKEIPFYLFLVTHRSPDIFKTRFKDMEKLYDRFHRIHFAMEPVTAYELIGNSIEEREDRVEDWSSKKSNLWERVKITLSLLDERGSEEKFKHLIPLHPYTAYLLSIISRSLSSSQRSLFKFLKSESEYGFANFIKSFPGQKDKLWITPDYLWDYFFAGPQKEDFPQKIREVVNYYESCKSLDLKEDSLSVLKTALLLIGLYTEVTEPITRPTLTNIKGCFQGVDSLEQEVEEIMRDLETRGLLHTRKISSSRIEYMLPLIQADEEEIRRIREELDRSLTFTKFTEELDRFIKSFLRPDPKQEIRHVLKVTSFEELARKRERILSGIKPYQVGVVALVLEEEDERLRAEELCKKCAEESDNTLFLLLNPAFGSENFKEWKDQEAYIIYCSRKNDYKHRDHYQAIADEKIKEWIRRLEIEKQKLFSKDDVDSFYIRDYGEIFYDNATHIYPYGPESVLSLTTLYTSKDVKQALEVGLGLRSKPSRQYLDAYDKLKDYEENPKKYGPRTPLYEIRSVVKEVLRESNHVRFVDIWKKLQEPPFGFHPTPAGRVLLGFAFREVCNGNYYLYDGASCYPLSKEGVRDALEKVSKGSRESDLLEVRKSSPQVDEFCNILRNIFDISEEQGRYPEELKSAIREKINGTKYPLWAAKYQDCLPHEKLFLDLLTHFIQENVPIDEGLFLTRDQIGKKIGKAIESWDELQSRQFNSDEIVAAILILNELIDLESLKKKLQTISLRLGMQRFLETHNRELYNLVIREKLDPFIIIKKLRELLQEEVWLWKELDVKNKLEEVLIDIRLDNGLRELTGFEDFERREILNKIKNNWMKELACINIFALAKEMSPDIQQPILIIARLIKDEKIDLYEKGDLAVFLSNSSNVQRLREAFMNSKTILRKWIYRETGYNISIDQFKDLAATSNYLLLEEDQEKLREEIKKKCKELNNARLYMTLREKWQELTATSSPKDWTNKYKVPVEWILEGRDMRDLIKLLDEDSPSLMETKVLEKAIHILETHRDIIREMSENRGSFVLVERLIPGAGKAIKKDTSFAEKLKEYLVLEMGSKPEDWISIESKLRHYARKFLEKYYMSIKDRVLSKIHEIPSRKLIKVLEELVEDPDIGFKILEKLE